MAETPENPLLDRMALEERFGGYEPPQTPEPLPNIPYKSVPTPSIGIGGGGASDKQPVSALKALDAAVSSKGDTRIRGGSIPRPISELTNPRYNVFVPGDYNNEDAYAQGQTWTEKMVNGVGKGLVLTGTTFLQSTVGMANGIFNWIGDGKFSSFYNNDLNKKLDDINVELDRNLLPNYETDVEKNARWYSPDNLFTANFLWNGIVKNLGFAAGAALSGRAFAAGINALSSLPGISRLVSIGKIAETVQATESSFLAANRAADTYGKIKSLSDKFLRSYNVLNPGGRFVVAGLATTGEAGFEAFQTLNEKRNELIEQYKEKNNGVMPFGEALAEIDRKAEEVGNSAFLLNVGLLTATNYIQFPKILGSSYTSEKGVLNALTRETREIVEEGGKYIQKPFTKNRVLATLNKIRPYTFSVSEAFEEGAQFAIGKGVNDYYSKKNNNEPTSFLKSLATGFSETFGTDEGMENILIGGLSGAIMQGRGRYIEDKAKAKNTAQAIEYFNKYRLSDFTKETIDAVNRGTVLQQEREQLLKKGDVLNSKDKEADYVINYLSPRIKYGRYDLVRAELADYRALASTDEGFAQLVNEGKALPTDTKEAFLSRLTKLEQTADNVKSLYQSLNLRYGGVVDDKGNPVYTSAVLDKMVYAASKVADYDVRIPPLSLKLTAVGVDVDTVVKDIVEGKVDSFNEAIDKIKTLGNLNEDEKITLGEALEDVAEMSIRRDSFLKEYDEIKKVPKNYQEQEPVPSEEAEQFQEKPQEKVQIKTKTGEKDYELNVPYFVGKGVDYEKDGLDAPVKVFSMTILGENPDGTIRIIDNQGVERNISKDVLQDYKLAKQTDLRSNKTANYFYNHRNEVFQYNFGKDFGGKKRGRLEYDNGKLFFVYFDNNNKLKRKELNKLHFVAQEGFKDARIKRVGIIENSEQKTSRQEFTSPEQIEQAKKEETLAKSKDKRIEIITQLGIETRERLSEVTKKLDAKKEQLAKVQEELDAISKEVAVSPARTKREKKLEEKYPELSRQKVRLKRVISTTSKGLTKLSRMKEDVENEINTLTAEKEELEFNLSYIEDFGQNLDELPENTGEFLQELKEQVKWLEMVIQQTGEDINTLSSISKSIEKAIKDFISLLHSSLKKLGDDYPQYIRDYVERVKDNWVFSEEPILKGYLADLALTEDLEKEISLNEGQLQTVNAEIADLYNKLEELGNQYVAKKNILNRFQSIFDAHQAMVAEEERISNNEKLKAELLGTADQSMQTVDFDESTQDPSEKSYAKFDKDYEIDSKKSDEVIGNATVGVMRGKAHQVRANTFGFNLNRFPNRKRIRGVYVTSKTEKEIGLEGLTDRLRMDEAGQINEDIDKDNIIALVMVEEIDGELKLLGVDGKPIPEGANNLDNAIYQVYPDGDLKWGKEYDSKSMFRDTTPKEVREAIIEQYKKKRASILEQTSIDAPHEIEASFGFVDKVKDSEGKVDYTTRTSVQDANLVTEDDIESFLVVRIPTLPSEGGKIAVESQGTTSMRVPVGTPLLETPNGLVKLQNRIHTEQESEVIYQAILQLARYMINPEVGINDAKSKRLLTWLRSVVYWGIPTDQQGNRKPAGYNSIFFERDPETKKLMLTLSGKGKDFRFTPSALEMNKDTILFMLNNMYNNINNSMVKNLSEPYEEILSISDKGEVTSRMWPNYQSYLLSSKTPDGKKRKGAELPLSTVIRPVVGPEDVNRHSIYFFTTDTMDDIVIPTVTKKAATPSFIKPAGAPKPPSPKPAAPEKAKTIDDLKKEKEDALNKIQKEVEKAADERDNSAYFDATQRLNATAEYYDAEIQKLQEKPVEEKIPPIENPEDYVFDGETTLALVSSNGRKIFFTATESVTPENYMETIIVKKGGDLENAKKVLEEKGLDYKKEIKTSIFNRIYPIIQERASTERIFSMSELKRRAGMTTKEEPVPPATPAPVKEAAAPPVSDVDAKPVRESVFNAVNRAKEKMNSNRREVLRLAIDQELKNFVPENWDRVEQWLKANFPNIPVYRVKNVIQATNGRQAWGMFQDGAIYIYENAEVGTVYHEVFHGVWRMFTDTNEQASILSEMRARKGKFFDRASLKDIKYSEATDEQLEEQLAEEFRDYVQFRKIPAKPEKGRPFILKLFSDLVTFIKNMFLKRDSASKVEDMFKRIGEGYYKTHIPFETNLSFAKQGIIDIEDAFASSESVFSLKGISDTQRSEIIQELTYQTLLDLLQTDKSLFELPKVSKKELYEKLKDGLLEVVASKIVVAQEDVTEKRKTQKEVDPLISSTLQLMENIEDQWDAIVERHQEYLKGYSIEFDENDIVNLRDENNSGRGDYQDATKIDNFKKANAAVKLLLSTVPKVKLNERGERDFEPSSIGGAILLPVSQVYISMMNNLHTSSNIEELMERFRQMAENDITYRSLYERVAKRKWSEKGVDLSKIETEHGLQLLSSLWRTFKKQSPEVKNVFILDNGDVVVGEANLASAAQQLKREYMNGIIFKARSNEGYFKYESGKNRYVGDAKKVSGKGLSDIPAILDFLKNLGIPFTDADVKKMNRNQKNIFEEAARGIRESIIKGDEIATFSGKVLSIDKRLMQLALVQSAINNPEFGSTYFNIAGERSQTFIGTNATSDLAEFLNSIERFDDANVVGSRYNYLKKDSFAKYSNLLARKFSKAGTPKDTGKDLFTVGIVGGTSNRTKGKEKESSKLTYKERLVQELNLNLAGWYLNLVPGDASIEHMIKMGNAISKESLNRGMGEIFEIFKGYFLSEFELAREDRPVAKKRKAEDMRFFKGILGENLHKDVVALIKNPNKSPEDAYNELEKKINAKLTEFINEDARKLSKVLKSYGILTSKEEGFNFENIETDKNLTEKQVDEQLILFSVNYMIANIEMHKLLYSDPYQYEDELKRIKSFNSPRQAIISGSKKMNAVMNKVWNRGYEKGDIGNTNFIRDYFRSATHADVIGIIDLPNYEQIKETDGGGIIFFKAHRNFRIRAGEWNSDEERQFRYDIAWEKRDRSEGLTQKEIEKRGLKLSKEEEDILKAGNPQIASAYTPLKPIVSGAKFDKNGNPNDRNYVLLDKFALYPLSYRISKEIDKDSNLVNLYNKMQNEDIDYIVFNSGRKVGAEKLHDTYTKEGAFNNAPYEGVINVPFSIMSIQAEVPSKDEPVVTRGSQVTKLVTLDFMEAGVPVDFESDNPSFEQRYAAWNALEDKSSYNGGKNIYNLMKENKDLLDALINEGYKRTLDRLGIEEVSYKDVDGVTKRRFEITDKSKAVTTLREEMLKREVNDNISDALNSFLNGSAVLEATPAYQQVRNILYSIADKEFISPKITGGMKVQIPSAFFESGNRKVKDNLYESDVLEFYKDKDGKRVAEVMLGRWFDSPLSDEELLKYLNTTDEGKKILSGIGFRIPTQKQNSIDAIVIKKFLPKEFGDSVVIPAALVQKVGSDFDIDKLSLYLKNVYKDAKGNIKLVPFYGYGKEALDKFEQLYKDIAEEKIDILKEGIDKLGGLQNLLGDILVGKASEKTKEKWTGILRNMFGENLYAVEVEDAIMKRLEKKGKQLKDLEDLDLQEVLMEQFKVNMYKKSLENRYMETMESLVTHPLNYDNLIKPNSAEVLKNLAIEIAEKTAGGSFDYTKVDNMLDRTFMSRLRHAFVRGKYAIGIAAVNQTNHSLNQRQPIYVDKDRLSLVSEEDAFWLGNAEVKFKDFNRIEVNGKMVPTLSMIKNKASEFISDIIGMFIDGYVDISKGPWIMELGATPNVASTWLFLIKIGVPLKQVTYFMNQPIIREYLQMIDNAGYSWLFIDSFVGEMAENYDVSITEEEYQRLSKNFVIPSQTILENNLSKEVSDMNANERNNQYMMLREFLKYAKMAEHMFHVTQGTNYDTANFNDPYLVFKKFMKYLKAKNTIISDVDELLDNSFIGDLSSHIKQVRDAFSEILMSDKSKVRNVIQNVLTPYVDMSDRDFVKVAQKAVSDLFDWAVQNDQKLNQMIQDILINDGGVGKEVMEFVTQVKENPNHPMRNNYVVNILESIPSTKAGVGGVNNVELKMKENKVYDQNNVIYSFRELRDYLGQRKSPLYERIKLLSVLQSGLSSSQISFTSLLPYEDFEKIYNITLSRLESISNLDDFHNLGVFQRNNWNNDDIVPYMTARRIYTATGPHYNPAMKFLPSNVINAVANKQIPPVMTVSRRNREGNSDYIVFTWEKQMDENLKNKMKKAGDMSYLNKGLFKKVYDPKTKQPMETLDKKGNKYFVYKAINAWGDGYRANEFWNTDHKSVIDNGFVQVEDVSDGIIVSTFLEKDKAKPEVRTTAGTVRPVTPSVKTPTDVAKQVEAIVTAPGYVKDTAKKHLPKELFKIRQATQFIGTGGGNDSTTQRMENAYKQVGLANTGNYTSNDLIYVSSNGNRGSRYVNVKNGVLQGPYQNIDKAITAGARFIMDTKSHIDATKGYNVGEVDMANYLSSKGYTRDDGTGIWSKGAVSTKVIGSETKMNIYAGTGENADLSNFAIRPFVIGGIKYQSVEQYYQLKKFQIAGILDFDYDAPNAQSIANKIDEIAQKIANTSNGAEIKKLGNTRIPGVTLDEKRWDVQGKIAMKEAMLESFKQNPQALQRLLATGNATFTHTQDKGKWGTEFPKLLMEVREELRSQPIVFSQEKQRRLDELENKIRSKAGLTPDEVGERNRLMAEKGREVKSKC